MRLFLGVPLPTELQKVLLPVVQQYPKHINRIIPPKTWHVTFVWLGDVDTVDRWREALLTPLPQTFVPTLSLTHVGRGRRPSQLWAYINPSAALKKLHAALLSRLTAIQYPLPTLEKERVFVPHIHLATFAAEADRVVVADRPLRGAFSPKSLTLYRSHGKRSYSVEGSISLL